MRRDSPHWPTCSARSRAARRAGARPAPGRGRTGAPRSPDWLSLHAGPLACILSPLAVVPRRQLGAGHPALTRPAVAGVVAPFEALLVPAGLDGSQGLNRAPVPAHQPAIANDRLAIDAWIRIRGSRSPHTERAYRREAERLLLGALLV